MKLYYSDILSAHRACAVARYLDAPLDYVYLDFAKGDHQKSDYLAINPNGKVRTLVKGGRITWEADAVICQLSEDMAADLWPHDARQIEITRWFRIGPGSLQIASRLQIFRWLWHFPTPMRRSCRSASSLTFAAGTTS